MQHHPIRAGFTHLAAVIGLLVGASLLGPDTAYAKSDKESYPDPAQRIEMRIERMVKDLDLTKAQQADIRKVMEAEQAQRDLQRQETSKQIDAVLTEAQKTKCEAMTQARMKRYQERMMDRLDLTEDQVTRIKTIFDEQRTHPALTKTELRTRVAAVLTDEQREDLKDRPKHHERLDCD